ncbi:hypothetical protein [Gluconacetobacter tumulisoli]|uniref:Uncharacterized protein n=1 Tax=Gluconacetobacter tumulisoli TaxID=1286189 RepID=A0A7W4PKD0_9PROT|nr:hypothetical protein [Gluconacetobacter tumulisoli]MBB2200708.1 hypothetical protein [Gluconacetobacter tumulisoli]
MPASPRQTLPIGDRPFVDAGTRGLTLAAYQFLSRLGGATQATARNVEVIARALGVPVAAIPADGPVSVTLPAAFPPPPDATPGLRDAVAGARLLAMLAAPPQVPPVARPDLPPPPRGPADVVVLHHGARVIDGFGTPSGRVGGWVGDVYLQRDGGAAGALWSKRAGAGTVDGWVAGGGGTGGVLPLVNGDVSPVGMITDPSGQTIGVPV